MKYVKKYERNLFCIPHLIGDRAGIGTNRLLKRGAKLVTGVEDILKYFDGIEIEEKEFEIEVPEEYKRIYQKIQREPINADEICKKIKKSISEVNTILTMLELEGFIESVPGNYYKRKEF